MTACDVPPCARPALYGSDAGWGSVVTLCEAHQEAWMDHVEASGQWPPMGGFAWFLSTLGAEAADEPDASGDLSLVEFLTARLDDEWKLAGEAQDTAAVPRSSRWQLWSTMADTSPGGESLGPRGTVEMTPERCRREIEAKRQVIALHEQWPVLVDASSDVEVGDATDLKALTVRMTQRMTWLTTQQYRARFGEEPPTGPVLLAMAQVYRDHPDFNPAWRQP